VGTAAARGQSRKLIAGSRQQKEHKDVDDEGNDDLERCDTSDDEIAALKRENKDVVLAAVQEKNKKLKSVEYELDNQRKNEKNLLERLEKALTQVDSLQSKLVEANVSSGASTVASTLTDMVVESKKEYTSGQRIHLGKYIRTEVFKKWKVTNKKSFEDNTLILQCHKVLGHGMEKDDNVNAYKDGFIKFVNTELGQKRSQVNGVLLKRWKGKSEKELSLLSLLCVDLQTIWLTSCCLF
jgi:hypothetical protein